MDKTPTIDLVTIRNKDFSKIHHLAYKDGDIIWVCSCIPANKEQMETLAIAEFKKQEKQAGKKVKVETYFPKPWIGGKN